MTRDPLPRAVRRLRLALGADEAAPDDDLLRLVNADGQPVPNAVLGVHYLMPGRDIWTPSFVDQMVRTDTGRMFKLTNLVAGLTYGLAHSADKGGGRQERHYRQVKPKARGGEEPGGREGGGRVSRLHVDFTGGPRAVPR